MAVRVLLRIGATRRAPARRIAAAACLPPTPAASSAAPARCFSASSSPQGAARFYRKLDQAYLAEQLSQLSDEVSSFNDRRGSGRRDEGGEKYLILPFTGETSYRRFTGWQKYF